MIKLNHKILFASLILFCHLLIFSKSELMAVTQSEFTNNKQNYLKNWVSVNNDFYYEYTALANGKSLYVTIIDQSLQTFILTFSKDNYLFLRASYRNFIIVQQMESQHVTVSYWVITIKRQMITNQTYAFKLDSFDISSKIDDQDFQFENNYTLTSIIQYRQQEQFLYVITQSTGDTDVYGIDVGNRGGQKKRLITIGWFYINSEKPQVIIGGNSRVLVQATESLVYIDTNNTRNNDSDPTVYNQKPISSFTSLTIYNHSRVYNLIDWYFQYTSLSLDHRQFTGFVFYGYSGETYGWYSMNSTTAIKYFADEYNFFMAVGSDDAYYTTVKWDEQKNDYKNQTGMLSTLIEDKQKLKAMISNLNQAWYVMYIDHNFYALGQQQLYLYDQAGNLKQMYLQQKVLQFEDLTYRTMKEIKRFRASTAAK